MNLPRFRPPQRRPRGRIPDPGAAARQGGSRRYLWLAARTLPVLLLIVLHQWLFPPTAVRERLGYRVGDSIEREIRAPVAFEAPRPAAEVEKERREAALKVEPLYRQDGTARRRTEQELAEFDARVAAVAAVDSLDEAGRLALLHESYVGLDDAVLRAVLDERVRRRVRTALDSVAARFYAAGVVDVIPQGNYEFVWVGVGNEGELRRFPVGQLILGHRLEEELDGALTGLLTDDQERAAAVALGRYFFLPDLVLDEAETEVRRNAAMAEVSPTRRYARSERIADAGTKVTPELLAVFTAMEQAVFEQRVGSNRWVEWKMRGGRAILLLLVVLGSIRLLTHLDPSLRYDLSRFALVHLLWGLFLATAAVAMAYPDWGGPAAVPSVLLAMTAVILFGEAMAYRVVAAGMLMLLVVPAFGDPLVVAWAASAVAAVRLLRRVRNRNQFYRALAVASAAGLVAVIGVEFGQAAPVVDSMRMGVRAVGSAAVCTALSLFLLPLLEALFGVTTELTLLELSDLNHPLLRRMALESPGTFHHSQVVGTLAETAARAIGANSLLTRVGANFHDIGKMLKPRYFAENQGPGNPHDELTPQMSALVIASHVKDGIELGREWGIPPTVLAFIPEHHGTSVMQYFYKKALEADDGGTIKVDDFRYPGPKPQTRETAILMLADGCEASVRSLRRPTASRIREMVRKIFDAKMAEGELEECGLTLRELATVREAFIPVLVSLHHQRVAYPGQREHEARKEKESREARARGRRGGGSVVSGI